MKLNQTLLRFLGWNTQGDLGPWTFYTDRRKGLVFFPRSPPNKPPSFLQRKQRNRFKMAAAAWRILTPEKRDAWSRAAAAAHLRITHHNFFVYWFLTKDDAAVRTVEHQTGYTLIT